MNLSRKTRIYVLFSILWTAYILANSLQPGPDSKSRSDGMLAALLHLLSLDRYAESELLRALIRKAAHFAEYAVLGTLLSGAFRQTLHRLRWPLLCGGAVALCDETVQLFVPRRSGSPADVALDAAAVACAVTAVWLLSRHHRRTKEQ